MAAHLRASSSSSWWKEFEKIFVSLSTLQMDELPILKLLPPSMPPDNRRSFNLNATPTKPSKYVVTVSRKQKTNFSHFILLMFCVRGVDCYFPLAELYIYIEFEEERTDILSRVKYVWRVLKCQHRRCACFAMFLNWWIRRKQ